MPNVYYPCSTDAEWREWGVPTSNLLVSEAATYEISVDAAGDLQSAARGYAAAFDVANAPQTQGRVATAAKNDALALVKLRAKPIMSAIELNAALGDELREQVGLRARDDSRSPAVVPALPPMVEAALTGPASMRVFVRQADEPDRRAKPKGVRSIVVFTHVNDGQVPPATAAAWTLHSQQGRSNFDLNFGELASPKTFWVRCQYVTTRNETGPMSEAAKIVLPGYGLSSDALSSGNDASPMKIAA
jgi:hypothetical protein